MTAVASDDFARPEPQRAPGNWRQTVALLATLIVLHIIVLRAMGRIWWCEAGDRSIIGHVGNHNSQHLLDWYTPSHLLHGVIFFWLLKIGPMRRWTLGTRLMLAAIVEIAWEILENTPLVIDRYRAATTAVSYYGDSVANSVADVIWCLLGFELARRIGRVSSVALFVFLELLTLVLIRDNLTLNVVMLLWPIDGVRQWQSNA